MMQKLPSGDVDVITLALSQRANVQNVSYKTSLQWPNYTIDSVDKPKLSFYTHN